MRPGWRGYSREHALAARGIQTRNNQCYMVARGWWGEHPLNSDIGLDTLGRFIKKEDPRKYLDRLYRKAKKDTSYGSLDAYLAITEYLYYKNHPVSEETRLLREEDLFPEPSFGLTKAEAIRASSLIRKYLEKQFPLESWGHPLLRRNAMVKIREKYIKYAKKGEKEK